MSIYKEIIWASYYDISNIFSKMFPIELLARIAKNSEETSYHEHEHVEQFKNASKSKTLNPLKNLHIVLTREDPRCS